MESRDRTLVFLGMIAILIAGLAGSNFVPAGQTQETRMLVLRVTLPRRTNGDFHSNSYTDPKAPNINYDQSISTDPKRNSNSETGGHDWCSSPPNSSYPSYPDTNTFASSHPIRFGNR